MKTLANQTGAFSSNALVIDRSLHALLIAFSTSYQKTSHYQFRWVYGRLVQEAKLSGNDMTLQLNSPSGYQLQLYRLIPTFLL